MELIRQMRKQSKDHQKNATTFRTIINCVFKEVTKVCFVQCNLGLNLFKVVFAFT